MSMSQSELRLVDMQLSKANRKLADAMEWIKASPHRSSCPSYGLPDVYQGQQHPCTCGRNHLLGIRS